MLLVYRNCHKSRLRPRILDNGDFTIRPSVVLVLCGLGIIVAAASVQPRSRYGLRGAGDHTCERGAALTLPSRSSRLPLAGSGENGTPPSVQPKFYQDLAQADAVVDAATAQSMISGYRSNNGLGPVAIDADLMRLASERARAMAARDRWIMSRGVRSRSLPVPPAARSYLVRR
jgi:hypothetical protein